MSAAMPLGSPPEIVAGRAEVRECQLRFLKRDDPVGEWSDIISTSTTP